MSNLTQPKLKIIIHELPLSRKLRGWGMAYRELFNYATWIVGGCDFLTASRKWWRRLFVSGYAFIKITRARYPTKWHIRLPNCGTALFVFLHLFSIFLVCTLCTFGPAKLWEWLTVRCLYLSFSRLSYILQLCEIIIFESFSLSRILSESKKYIIHK